MDRSASEAPSSLTELTETTQLIGDPFSVKFYLDRADLHPLVVGPRLLNIGSDEGVQWWPPFGQDEVTGMQRVLGTRNIKVVYPFANHTLDKRTKTYFTNVPDVTIDHKRNALRVPAAGIMRLGPQALERLTVNSVKQFSEALRTSVLETTEEIMRLLAPEAEEMRFVNSFHLAPVPDAYWDVYTLRKPEVGDLSASPSNTAMVVICVPPGFFGPKDFLDFTQKRTIPYGRLDKDEGAVSWSPVETLWAVLYDWCNLCDCNFFAVTSYNEWALGAFSKSKRSVRISRPYVARTTAMRGDGPTFLQTFTHWCVLARGLSESERWNLPSDGDFPSYWFNHDCKRRPSVPDMTYHDPTGGLEDKGVQVSFRPEFKEMGVQASFGVEERGVQVSMEDDPRFGPGVHVQLSDQGDYSVRSSAEREANMGSSRSDSYDSVLSDGTVYYDARSGGEGEEADVTVDDDEMPERGPVEQEQEQEEGMDECEEEEEEEDAEEAMIKEEWVELPDIEELLSESQSVEEMDDWLDDPVVQEWLGPKEEP